MLNARLGVACSVMNYYRITVGAVQQSMLGLG